MDELIEIGTGGALLVGDLIVPDTARGIVIFAHGSGSSRLSTRNRFVASRLRESGRFGTLLFDLLTPAEDDVYANRFDIPLLAERLVAATTVLQGREGLNGFPIGYFGASTGAAAAIVAATRIPTIVRAVVSRGGRPDLAREALALMRTPTLLIVGGADTLVIDLNQQAFRAMPASDKRLEIIPGATHLFEEPGTLEEAAGLALAWFDRYLTQPFQ